MKKKQKINKVVNHGELVLLGLTALFLCFLFAIRDRPAPESVLTVRTSALPGKSAEPAPVTSSAEHENPAASGDGLVNINTADLSALCGLPGIGESLAGRVIAYREEHGDFERPEDIMNVSGIGQGKFAAMRGLITVE